MSGPSGKTSIPPRSQSVREDWVACLPKEKDRAYEAALGDLETSYTMLSVALNEAFLLRAQGALGKAQEATGISADLFDRAVGRLLHVLRTLHEYGRHLGHLPAVAPLDSDNFRGPTSQRLARNSSMLCKVLFSSRSRFFHKVSTLSEASEEIAEEFRQIAREISEGISIEPKMDWGSLEILHYDFNTCLRESIVVLRSFVLILPDGELRAFQQTLQTVTKEPRHSARTGSSAFRHRRASVI